MIAQALACAGLAALLSAPMATAQYAGGTFVEKADYDYTPRPSLSGLGGSLLCFVDDEGRGVYQPGAPLYVILSGGCPDGVQTKDVRLSPVGSLKPATEVATTDPDRRMGVSGPLPHFVRWAESAAEASFDTKDWAYLDLTELASKRVNIGDVRLVPTPTKAALSVVQAGDPDVNLGLEDFGAGISIGMANIFYKAGSTYYINTDAGAIGTADITVEEKDIRLNNKAPNPWGTTLADVRATAVRFTASEVLAGATTPVLVDLENRGKGAGAGLLVFRINGQIVDAKLTPYVAAGGRPNMTVNLLVPLATSGPSLFAVNDVFQTVEVVASPGAPAADDAESLLARIATLESRLAALEDPAGPVEAQTDAAEVKEAKATSGVDVGLLVITVGVAAILLRRK